MEIVTTEEEVNVFTNPFLTIAPATIKEVIDASITGSIRSKPQITPLHNFAIISQYEQGIRYMVFSEYTNAIENAAAHFIFNNKDWQKFLIWDVGSICLEEEGDRLFLTIDHDLGCDTTNILISRSFIGIIFENLKKKFYNYEGQVLVQYKMLYESSFKKIHKPKSIITRPHLLK